MTARHVRMNVSAIMSDLLTRWRSVARYYQHSKQPRTRRLDRASDPPPRPADIGPGSDLGLVWFE